MNPGQQPDILETHPWPPFIPEGAGVLIMGTFPPQPHRWSMDFYYPNPTNDFWPMMGLIFFGDRYALCTPDHKNFDLDAIKRLLAERHIALNDTGHTVRRLRNNASDKYLEIVEPVDLAALLGRMPRCQTIATTGEKAAVVIASLTGSQVPPIGQPVHVAAGATPSVDRDLTIWRMPSTSRAYPLPLDQKAAFYRRLFTGLSV